jgi:YesN/AraC family two-component response regulator
MVRVLLADDEPVVLRGLRARFQLEADVQVVGEASTGTATRCAWRKSSCPMWC